VHGRRQQGGPQLHRQPPCTRVAPNPLSSFSFHPPPPPPGCVSAVYLRYEWHGLPAAVCTPLVLAPQGPLGGAASAAFLAHRLLPPPPGGVLGGGGGEEPPELLLQVRGAARGLPHNIRGTMTRTSPRARLHPFTYASPCPSHLQLWHRALDAAAAVRLPPLHLAAEAQPLVRDALVGCAAVDLAALRALGALDGWYHIADGARARRGQVKVEVRAAWG
jgi:hypothetical protein